MIIIFLFEPNDSYRTARIQPSRSYSPRRPEHTRRFQTACRDV